MFKFFKKIFFLLSFSYTYMFATEPVLAILKSVYSNGLQQFSYKNYNVYCKPYGVSLLEDIYYNNKLPSGCVKELDSFYKKNPTLKYFSLNMLHIKQMYHIKYKDNTCILYANGQKTLSEYLVENGLASKQKYLKDAEFNYKLGNAQKRATYRKKGFHKNTILRNCMLNF